MAAAASPPHPPVSKMAAAAHAQIEAAAGPRGRGAVAAHARWLLWWKALHGPAAAMGETEKLYYVYSCDLDINVQLKM